jgi:hypothetical protein
MNTNLTKTNIKLNSGNEKMDGTGFKPQHCPQKKKKKQRI